MLGELAIRFVVGGLVVALFSLVGELLKPKTFAGILGAAPSMALVSLALAALQHGGAYASEEGRAMTMGAVALGIYSASAATLTRIPLPTWLSAGLLWVVWALAAGIGALFLR